MAKKVVLSEEVLRQKLTGAIPVFVPPAMPPVAASATIPPTEDRLQNQPEKLKVNVNVESLLDDSENKVVHAETHAESEDKDLQKYEKAYLSRNLLGLPRTNVGISMETLTKVEQVLNRLFDGQIAVSTFVDNVIFEHLIRHEKLYNKWLMEKSRTIF
ncbi:MAG: DUF3408 domain-containing protein [Prevotellaceae bacterium]|jgi:hypothetical protein|nr:DUF3408 domain-containing protein [Prevotellaceae bacterium]